MKKFIGFVLVLLAVITGWAYFFLPSSRSIVTSLTMNAPASRIYPFLAKQSNWTKWWPGAPSENPTYFPYKNHQYRVVIESMSIIETETKHNDDLFNGRIYVSPTATDSSVIECPRLWNNSLLHY